MERLFEYSEENLPLYIFEEISGIPRESGNETEIRNFLIQRAQDKGFEAIYDEANNVIIKKPGSKGYEDYPPIILQAHMDMVCEKLITSEHDFRYDPIELVVDGDMIRAEGTTLGADDGIGVALGMSVLESDDFSHPPLELLFTAEEETSFHGAESINGKLFKGHRVINLDFSEDDKIVVGSCGGVGMKVKLLVQKERVVRENGKAWEISITGMPGGHSGEDVNKGYGSAIQLMTRVLRQLLRQFDIGLVSLKGGSNRLALARECKAVVLTYADLLPTLKKMQQIFINEYGEVTSDLEISVKQVEIDGLKYSGDGFDRIMTLLTLFPDGIMQMNGAFPGVVGSSINMGIVDERDGQFYIEAEIRGDRVSTILDIAEKVAHLVEIKGGTWEKFGNYAPWQYNPESQLCKKAMEVYEETFGEIMTPMVLHAGLECSLLGDNISNMDAISIGPNMWNCHSPNEQLSISSTKKIWRYLKLLLGELR